MQGLSDLPPFEYACQELRPGWWIAQVDAPLLHLQLDDVYLVAVSSDDVEWQVTQLLSRIVWRISHPPRACLN